MIYRDSDYLRLKVVSNPDSDFGFDVVCAETGRPVAGIVNVNVDRGIDTDPPFRLKPQRVTVTLLGIPVALDFPDWDSFAHSRHVARERARQAEEAACAAAPPPPPELPPVAETSP